MTFSKVLGFYSGNRNMRSGLLTSASLISICAFLGSGIHAEEVKNQPSSTEQTFTEAKTEVYVLDEKAANELGIDVPGVKSKATALKSMTTSSFDETQGTLTAYPMPDYLERRKVEERLQVFGETMLGDSIDTNSGRVSFAHTDVSIPGNFDLPVEIRRTTEAGFKHATTDDAIDYGDVPRGPKRFFSDWSLDIPRVNWIYPIPLGRLGFKVLADRASRNFCESNFTSTALVVHEDANGNTTIATDPVNHWDLSNEMELIIPGQGTKKLLEEPAGIPLPEDVVKVTSDYWVARCIPANDDAFGLSVTSPNGTVYTFDRFYMAPETGGRVGFSGRVAEHVIGGTRTVPRVNLTLLPTQITDADGNWVRYEYDTNFKHTRLRKIHSSDKREIIINYKDDQIIPIIKDVVANGRTWFYFYETNSSGDDYLARVVRPDNRKWEFDFGSIPLNPNPAYDCEVEDKTWTITHPSGVQGTFVYRETKHRLNLDPELVNNATAEPCRPKFIGEFKVIGHYDALSLISKKLTGPGMSDYEWQFEYSEKAPGDKWTKVTDPQGKVTKYYYYTTGELEGLEIKSEVYENATATAPVMQTEYTYQVEAPLGITHLYNQEQAKLTQPRHQKEIKQIVDGSEYVVVKQFNVNQADENYSFSAPVTITESNSFTSKTRETTKTYLHLRDKWKLALPRVTKVNGRVTEEITYTDIGRIQGIAKNNLDATTFTYHDMEGAKGVIESVTPPGSQATYALNWKRGTAQQIKRPDNASMYQYVDDNGWLTKTIDFKGNEVSYRHDEIGRLKAIDYDDSQLNDTEFSYTYLDSEVDYSSVEEGMLKQTITTGSREVRVYYDGMQRNRFEVVRDTEQGSTTLPVYTKTDFDGLNRETFKSYPGNSELLTDGVQTEYDVLNRVIIVNDNTISGTTEREYLSANRVRVTDNMGNQTLTHYRAFGQPAQEAPLRIESPESVTTQFIYDKYDNLTAIIQGGMTESRVFDEHNRLCKVIRNDVGNKAIGYKTNGQIQWEVTGSSVLSDTQECATLASLKAEETITYKYNVLDMLERIEYGDGTPAKQYDYDLNGNIETLTFGNVENYYEYTSFNSPKLERLSIGTKQLTIQYTYNPNRQLYSTIYPDGEEVLFSPDINGLPTRASDYVNNVSYHPNGAVKQFSYGNGFVHSMQQYDNGMPRTLSDVLGAKKAVDYTAIYDDNGNLMRLTDGQNSLYNLHLGYDGLNRLTTVHDSFRGSGSYTYDQVGNITHYTLGNFQLNYGYLDNRLTRVWGSKTTSYGYDARGNITNNGTHEFTYNLAQHVVSSADTSTGTTYTYDGKDKRVQKVKDGVTTLFFYGLNGKLMYKEKEGEGATNYIYLGSKLVAKHTDIDEPSGRQHYAPYGEPESGESHADKPSYTGHLYDDDLGLNYMQARYYDPVIGRFYSNDPVGYTAKNPVMSFNRYMYVNNNPYKYKDPNGEFLAGAFFSAALDVGIQLIENRGDITKVDPAQTAIAFVTGAVGAGIGEKIAKAGSLVAKATNSKVAGATVDITGNTVAAGSIEGVKEGVLATADALSGSDLAAGDATSDVLTGTRDGLVGSTANQVVSNATGNSKLGQLAEFGASAVAAVLDADEKEQ